jgi:hypothetical protein
VTTEAQAAGSQSEAGRRSWGLLKAAVGGDGATAGFSQGQSVGAADVLASFSVTKVGAAANGAGNGATNGTFEVENGKGVSTYRLPTKKELREREEWAARERANVVKMMGSSQDVEDVAVPTPLRTIPTDRNVWATPEAPQIALSRDGCTATDTAQVPTTGDSGAGRYRCAIAQYGLSAGKHCPASPGAFNRP